MPKVLIADDEEFVRYYLRTLIDSIFFEVVGEVESGEKLYDAIDELSPDILLLDINMPMLKGNEFIEKNKDLLENLCIIILTISSSTSLKEELDEMGVKFFLRKDTPQDEMIKYIQKSWQQFLKDKQDNV